jgi:hypothetical protein
MFLIFLRSNKIVIFNNLIYDPTQLGPIQVGLNKIGFEALLNEDFFSQPHVSFSPFKNPILPPKASVNTNRIFENFSFYLPKFSNIEKHVFQPFIFQKTQKNLVNVFQIFQKKRF